MFLQKSDIFKNMSQETISEISEIAVEERHEAGSVLFRQGDPARYFYLLVDGKVQLFTERSSTPQHAVTKIGELFGWSAAVGRESYCASAECIAPTTVMKIGSSDLERVLDNHPQSGKAFYKLLAEALGQRWVDLQRAWMSGGVA